VLLYKLRFFLIAVVSVIIIAGCGDDKKYEVVDHPSPFSEDKTTVINKPRIEVNGKILQGNDFFATDFTVWLSKDGKIPLDIYRTVLVGSIGKDEQGFGYIRGTADFASWDDGNYWLVFQYAGEDEKEKINKYRIVLDLKAPIIEFTQNPSGSYDEPPVVSGTIVNVSDEARVVISRGRKSIGMVGHEKREFTYTFKSTDLVMGENIFQISIDDRYSSKKVSMNLVFTSIVDVNMLSVENYLILNTPEFIRVAVGSSIYISGSTDSRAVLTINDEKIQMGAEGKFSYESVFDGIVNEYDILSILIKDERRKKVIITHDSLNFIENISEMFEIDEGASIFINGLTLDDAKVYVDDLTIEDIGGTFSGGIFAFELPYKMNRTSILIKSDFMGEVVSISVAIRVKPPEDIEKILEEADVARDEADYGTAISQYQKALDLLVAIHGVRPSESQIRKQFRKAVWNQIVIMVEEQNYREFLKIKSLLALGRKGDGLGDHIYQKIYKALNHFYRAESNVGDITYRDMSEADYSLAAIQLEKAGSDRNTLWTLRMPGVNLYDQTHYNDMIDYFIPISNYNLYLISRERGDDFQSVEDLKSTAKDKLNTYIVTFGRYPKDVQQRFRQHKDNVDKIIESLNQG